MPPDAIGSSDLSLSIFIQRPKIITALKGSKQVGHLIKFERHELFDLTTLVEEIQRWSLLKLNNQHTRPCSTLTWRLLGACIPAYAFATDICDRDQWKPLACFRQHYENLESSALQFHTGWFGFLRDPIFLVETLRANNVLWN